MSKCSMRKAKSNSRCNHVYLISSCDPLGNALCAFCNRRFNELMGYP